ncbi:MULTISPECIES: hypothetical protein [Methanosarcina]|uniref:hypothetical protein n=1 Tax=Methanosarcina TaxID=2207 RepID=UPI000A9699DB|nr:MULTISPECIES: hypothetical protein [Methanosarcina]
MADATLKKRSEITGMKEPGIMTVYVNHGMKIEGEREFWKEAFSIKLPKNLA